MSYRIDYGANNPAPIKKAGGRLCLPVLTGIFLLVFVLSVRLFWPEGRQCLRRLLISDREAAVSHQAFGQFLGDLKAGDAPSDAFAAFCREVIDHAGLTQ